MILIGPRPRPYGLRRVEQRCPGRPGPKSREKHLPALAALAPAPHTCLPEGRLKRHSLSCVSMLLSPLSCDPHMSVGARGQWLNGAQTDLFSCHLMSPYRLGAIPFVGMKPCRRELSPDFGQSFGELAFARGSRAGLRASPRTVQRAEKVHETEKEGAMKEIVGCDRKLEGLLLKTMLLRVLRLLSALSSQQSGDSQATA